MKHSESQLTNKAVYGNQTLGDGIDRQKKTFKSYGAEQRRTVGRDEAWGSDYIPVQRQSCFRDGPNVSLSAGDHDALRARGFQLKPFRQRSGHYAKSSAGVHEELDFFDAPCRAGQMSLYVEQSHLKVPFKNIVHCSSDNEQRNSTDRTKSGATATSW